MQTNIGSLPVKSRSVLGVASTEAPVFLSGPIVLQEPSPSSACAASQARSSRDRTSYHSAKVLGSDLTTKLGCEPFFWPISEAKDNTEKTQITFPPMKPGVNPTTYGGGALPGGNCFQKEGNGYWAGNIYSKTGVTRTVSFQS